MIFTYRSEYLGRQRAAIVAESGGAGYWALCRMEDVADVMRRALAELGREYLRLCNQPESKRCFLDEERDDYASFEEYDLPVGRAIERAERWLAYTRYPQRCQCLDFWQLVDIEDNMPAMRPWLSSILALPVGGADA